jgi:hypothetical protein
VGDVMAGSGTEWHDEETKERRASAVIREGGFETRDLARRAEGGSFEKDLNWLNTAFN